MKFQILAFAAVLLSAEPTVSGLGFFEVPISAEEEPKVKAAVAAQDLANREKIDFTALNSFIVAYAKGRGVVAIGEKNDRYSVDLAAAAPSSPWKLVDPLHLQYISGSWRWEFDGDDLLVWFSDLSLRVSLKIKIDSKKNFVVGEEKDEDLRNLLDG